MKNIVCKGYHHENCRFKSCNKDECLISNCDAEHILCVGVAQNFPDNFRCVGKRIERDDACSKYSQYNNRLLTTECVERMILESVQNLLVSGLVFQIRGYDIFHI